MKGFVPDCSAVHFAANKQHSNKSCVECVRMDEVPISNSVNPHCPKFDDLIKFDQEHKIDGKLNYEQIRQRNIDRNKLILRSLGLSLMAQDMTVYFETDIQNSLRV